jgi:hypothetical protein
MVQADSGARLTPDDTIGLTDADFSLTQDEVSAVQRAAEAAVLDGSTMSLGHGEDGAVERLHFDDVENTVTLSRVDDVQSVLDWCKGRFNAGLADSLSEFRQIASIPPDVLAIWANAKGYKLPADWMLRKDYHDLVIAAAHDRDLSGFRTLAGTYL